MIFFDEVSTWRDKTAWRFIDFSCDKIENKIIGAPQPESLESFFKEVHFVLGSILADLHKSDFLCSLNFAVDQSNYKTHWIAEHVIKGSLLVDPQIGGVNFKQSVELFLRSCATIVKQVLDWHICDVMSQVERLKDKQKDLSEANAWMFALRESFSKGFLD